MKIKTSFFLVLFSLVLLSQNISSFYLPEPENLNKTIYKTALKSKIIYGKEPRNYNGKVLVFVHGLSTTASTMLKDNTLYEDSYNEGFRAVFITMTKFGGDWENGKILADAIKQITQELKVPTVTLIAHSNGGKAAEVSMYSFYENKKVDRVITLGTPFWGTYLADASQNIIIKNIVNLLFSEESLKLSTTYYCRDYFRPFFDRSPLNEPEKFYNFGAWGYFSREGNFSLALFTSGNFLLDSQQGYNDGITPFSSILRPGGKVLAESDDPIGHYNHYDIEKGKYVWKSVILPALADDTLRNSPSVVSKNKLYTNAEPYVVNSNYQILFSNKKEDYAWLSSQTKNVKVDVIHGGEMVNFNLKNLNGRVIQKVNHKFKKNTNRNYLAVEKENPYLVLLNHIFSFNLSKIQNFKLDSNSPYVAFVYDSEDNPMVYKINRKERKVLLEVSFPKLTIKEQESLILQANYAYIGDLRGKGEREEEQVLIFKKEGDKFLSDVSGNKPGIYTLTLNAEIAKSYKRSLISGFVITNNTDSSIEKISKSKEENQILLFGNPINHSSYLHIPFMLNGMLHLGVYNFSGQLVKEITLPFSPYLYIGKYLEDLSGGNYFLQMKIAGKQYNVKFFK